MARSYNANPKAVWPRGTAIEDKDRVPGEVMVMLNCYTKWLNWIDEDINDGDGPVKVDDWWLDVEYQSMPGKRWTDCPVIVKDIRDARYMEVGGATRVMQVRGSAFHDEGGPALLTAGFDFCEAGGVRYEGLGSQGEGKKIEKDSWELSWMVATFDCQTDLIVNDGEVVRKDMR